MSSGKWWPSCLHLDVLNQPWVCHGLLFDLIVRLQTTIPDRCWQNWDLFHKELTVDMLMQQGFGLSLYNL